MNVLDSALQAAMLADTGAGNLATLSNGGFHQKIAPRNAVFNYTVFMEILDLPDYAFGNRTVYNSLVYQISHFSVDGANNTTKSGAELSGSMADRCRVILTNPTLSVSGKTVLCCKYRHSVPFRPEWDEANNRFIHGAGSYFEVWLA